MQNYQIFKKVLCSKLYVNQRINFSYFCLTVRKSLKSFCFHKVQWIGNSRNCNDLLSMMLQLFNVLLMLQLFNAVFMIRSANFHASYLSEKKSQRVMGPRINHQSLVCKNYWPENLLQKICVDFLLWHYLGQ